MEWINNNDVYLAGTITTDFTFDHEIHGKVFYGALMEVSRLSTDVDTVKIIIEEDKLQPDIEYVGVYAEVYGGYRTYKKFTYGKNRMMTSIYVKDFLPWGNSGIPRISAMKNNQIFLNGTVRKLPIYRSTPKNRKITELLVAVERKSGTCDFIPCIAWNQDAIEAAKLKLNDEIQLYGRIQSRIYLKEGEPRQVNEVSIRKLIALDRHANVHPIANVG